MSRCIFISEYLQRCFPGQTQHVVWNVLELVMQVPVVVTMLYSVELRSDDIRFFLHLPGVPMLFAAYACETNYSDAAFGVLRPGICR